MNILVTGAGSRIGQAIIRLIKKKNKSFLIFSTDYLKDSIGFFWSDNYEILPDILKVNESIWLKKIERIISKNNINLIIPGIDFELPIFAKYKIYLETKYNLVCLVSNLNEISQFNNKYSTYIFLKKNGLDFPKTSLLKDKNLFLKKNQFPVILKPVEGSTSKGIFVINKLNELNNISVDKEKYIIQEKINGIEITSGAIVFNKKIISLIHLKRNLRNGNTHSASLYFNKRIDSYIKKIVKVSNFFGPINFQLFYSRGKCYLIEINPRFSGTSYSRSLFGLNEFSIIYAFLFKNINHPSYKLKSGSIIKYIEDKFFEKTKIF